MRTKEYNAFFRRLAEEHLELGHSPENMRFVRMTLSSDPVQRLLDLTEFHSSIKNKIKRGFFMILQNYEAGYADNGGDRREKMLYGSFVILRIADINDPEDQEAAYDDSERIGEELIGAALPRINNLGCVPQKRMSASDVTSDSVAKVAMQYYGTRFDFSFRLAANKELKFKPEKFNG